jgi:5-methylcytosine-specific restriction endonuclease McrA
MKRVSDSYWWNLKDQVKGRARIKSQGKCEYCWLRHFNDLHHRHYATEGQERLEDVMLVCRVCHDHIHGYRRGDVYVHPDSPAGKGDFGKDLWYFPNYKTPQWRAYLADTAPVQA